MKIAIMQPYFIPYTGYFRLFASVDLFVALDCVQFPRRGWVHRNKLSDNTEKPIWLTLPIEKSCRDTTRICDTKFRHDAQETFDSNCRKFPSLSKLNKKYTSLYSKLSKLEGDPTSYIITTLESINDTLGITRPIVRSSSLNINPDLKAQSRILEIAKHFNATDYINAPGGKDLYDGKIFLDNGINLHFLKEHDGSYSSIIERISNEPLSSIADEISRNLTLESGFAAS